MYPVRGDGHSSRARLAERLMQPTRTADPEADWKRSPASAPSLFGLAPGGVCRAVLVAKNAVRSYRTLSPLPFGPSPARKAVCFLWHCPWGHPRRRLSGTVLPWSPDFPPRPYAKHEAERPSGLLTGLIRGLPAVPSSRAERQRYRATTGPRPPEPLPTRNGILIASRPEIPIF